MSKFDEEKFEQAAAAMSLLSDAVPPAEFCSAVGHVLAVRSYTQPEDISRYIELIKQAADAAIEAVAKELEILKGGSNVQ